MQHPHNLIDTSDSLPIFLCYTRSILSLLLPAHLHFTAALLCFQSWQLEVLLLVPPSLPGIPLQLSILKSTFVSSMKISSIASLSFPASNSMLPSVQERCSPTHPHAYTQTNLGEEMACFPITTRLSSTITRQSFQIVRAWTTRQRRK